MENNIRTLIAWEESMVLKQLQESITWGLFVEAVFLGIFVYGIQKIFDLLFYKKETRFANLQESQAEVISNLYHLLVSVQLGLKNIVWGMKRNIDSDYIREKRNEIEQLLDEFWEYFQKKRIYLPSHLCNKLESFFRGSLSASASIGMVSTAQELSKDDPSYLKFLDEDLSKASRLTEDNIPAIKSDIEKEFRDLLGH